MQSFMTTFLSFIVRSPAYYNIPRDQSASVLGGLAFIAELVMLPFSLVLGAVMDAFGRKIPTIVGIMIAGIAIILIPFGKDIYPELCIYR